MSERWIDVREYPEFAAGHIQGAELVPLQGLRSASVQWDRQSRYTLICKTGSRAERACKELESQGFQHLTVLPGGMEQWAASGKPLVKQQRRPWSMERQVRATAGALVLVTMALAISVSRYFLLGTAFVGAGLIFAGVSDLCMMASLLGWLPWNRQPRRLA